MKAKGIWYSALNTRTTHMHACKQTYLNTESTVTERTAPYPVCDSKECLPHPNALA